MRVMTPHRYRTSKVTSDKILLGWELKTFGTSVRRFVFFCNRRFVPPFDVNAHLSAWAVVRTTHQPHQKDTTGHQNGPIGAYKKPRCGSSGFVFFNKNKLPERLLDAAYRWTYRTVDLELDHI